MSEAAVYVELPDELAGMPPGPALSALLATIDPASLNGWQLVEVVQARSRQLAYEQAQLLVAVRELAYTPTGGSSSPPLRRPDQDPYAGPEVAFALACSDYAAELSVSVAIATIETMPAVFEALQAGRLDWTKTKMICTEMTDVAPEHVGAILDRLLPEVDRCNAGQIRARLRRLILQVDPDAARQRHEKAVQLRCVQHHEYANATAGLSGVYLPKEKAAAAWNHIDAIAQATKHAGGETRDVDQIRADVFADLLAGIDPSSTGHATPAVRRSNIVLQVNLSTLAHLDDEPGEIAGFGPVIADIARQTAAQLAESATWRFAVSDDDDQVIAAGRTVAPTPDAWTTLNKRASETGGVGGFGPVDRAGYRPTAAQKAFVQTRDRTCRAPGCRRPAQTCELDHIRDWVVSRDTSITNLCALCKRHHRTKHVAGHKVRRTRSGIEWITPRGRHYTVLADDAPAPRAFDHTLLQLVYGFHQPGRLRR